MSTAEAGAERLVALEGAVNFRDLGGYPAAGDRRTRWGRLYRSDALHELTPSDVADLRRRGLRTIIDLRTPGEVDQTGRGLLGEEPAYYEHLSVVRRSQGEERAAPAATGHDLADRYFWYLDVGRDALLRALELVTDADRTPLVFHCTAGKDRTGILAALALDAIGVDRRCIVEDYVLTDSRLPLVVERLRRDPVHGPRMGEIPPERLRVRAESIENFFDLLDERHGGARSWAVSEGFDEARFDRFAGWFLEPDGS